MRTSIEELPAPLLGAIFHHVGNRRNDALVVLNTSKAWLQAALDHCPSWWERLHLRCDRLGQALEAGGEAAWAGFRSGFAQRAGKLRWLSVEGPGGELEDELPWLLQQCAAAGRGDGQLQALRLNARFNDPNTLAACCEAVGQLQGLTSLYLVHDTGISIFRPEDADNLPTIPLAALAPLSQLTHLQALTINFPKFVGAVPDLCGRMAKLSNLAFLNPYSPAVPIASLPWHSTPESTPLLELRLQSADLRHAQGEAAAILQPLTRLWLQNMEFLPTDPSDAEFIAALCGLSEMRHLGLWEICCPPPPVEALPRFQHLTRLELFVDVSQGNDADAPVDLIWDADSDRVAMDAVLRCGQLQELRLGGSCLCESGVSQLPPGALQHLSRLELQPSIAVETELPPAPFCQLPSLQILNINGANGVVLLHGSISQLSSLQEVVIHHALLLPAAPCFASLAALTALTKLDMRSSKASTRPFGMGGAFWDVSSPGTEPLAALRELRPGRIPLSYIPNLCRLAPSVQVLDLSALVLRGATPLRDADVEYFQHLASLRQLLLPQYPEGSKMAVLGAGVLEHFRRELPGMSVEEAVVPQIENLLWLYAHDEDEMGPEGGESEWEEWSEDGNSEWESEGPTDSEGQESLSESEGEGY